MNKNNDKQTVIEPCDYCNKNVKFIVILKRSNNCVFTCGNCLKDLKKKNLIESFDIINKR